VATLSKPQPPQAQVPEAPQSKLSEVQLRKTLDDKLARELSPKMHKFCLGIVEGDGRALSCAQVSDVF